MEIKQITNQGQALYDAANQISDLQWRLNDFGDVRTIARNLSKIKTTLNNTKIDQLQRYAGALDDLVYYANQGAEWADLIENASNLNINDLRSYASSAKSIRSIMLKFQELAGLDDSLNGLADFVGNTGKFASDLQTSIDGYHDLAGYINRIDSIDDALRNANNIASSLQSMATVLQYIPGANNFIAQLGANRAFQSFLNAGKTIYSVYQDGLSIQRGVDDFINSWGGISNSFAQALNGFTDITRQLNDAVDAVTNIPNKIANIARGIVDRFNSIPKMLENLANVDDILKNGLDDVQRVLDNALYEIAGIGQAVEDAFDSVGRVVNSINRSLASLGEVGRRAGNALSRFDATAGANLADSLDTTGLQNTLKAGWEAIRAALQAFIDATGLNSLSETIKQWGKQLEALLRDAMGPL